ncbi:SCO1431 family membrane protein [Streptomyces laurentii]|uniref:SCO1431 family membrane protein n=1 Tax=Streptomyces laurentii TaxID=39478 RepID=UPI00367860C9
MSTPSPAAADSAASAAVRTAVRIGARVRAGARTGGPKDDGPRILEQILGWTLVVVLAVFVTRAGLM